MQKNKSKLGLNLFVRKFLMAAAAWRINTTKTKCLDGILGNF